MKRIVIFGLLQLFSASLALASWDLEAGDIGIFADNAGTTCNLSGAPGLLNVYFLCVGAIDATSSEWAAPHPACLTAEHISDSSPQPIFLGDTETGISVGYGTCKTGTFLIMMATYNVLTPATVCCYWPVGPDPRFSGSGKIETSDCGFMMHFPPGGQAVVNATSGCTCSVPVEDTSWGRVKALYAE